MTEAKMQGWLSRCLPLMAAAMLTGCVDTLAIDEPAMQPAQQAAEPAIPIAPLEDYKISPLDLLEVKVFQVKDLDGVQQVSQSGYITLPLIGDVKVGGKTVKQVQTQIAAQLDARFVRNPHVQVFVKETAGQRYTVEGAVNAPGIYPISGGASLLQAIATAKGPTKIAENEVVVFRAVNGARRAERYDLEAIRTGKAEDPALLAGDIVVVGESAVRNAWANVKDVITPGLGVAGVALRLAP